MPIVHSVTRFAPCRIVNDPLYHRPCEWQLFQLRNCRSTVRSTAISCCVTAVAWNGGSTRQRKFTTPKKAKRRLSLEEITWLGTAMAEAAGDHENATGIGAIRVLLLTGFRRMEGLGLKRSWVRGREGAVYFPDTKSDFQIRVIGRSAVETIKAQPGRKGSDYVFPADVGDGHFIGVVRVLQRVCKRAKLTGVTPHTLRHTFASVAGDLGFSELTIAGLLGHAPRGMTQDYIHLDAALVVAANQVSDELARALTARPSAISRRSRPRIERAGVGLHAAAA